MFVFKANDSVTLSCKPCSGPLKSGFTNNMLDFQEFGEIPTEIKNVSGYAHLSKMALCNLYCGVFKKPGFSYWHYNGQV